MSIDSKAPTGRPAWAVCAWADDNNIYIELSGMHGPYIVKFPLNENGLSKALHLMKDCHRKMASPIYQAQGVNPAYKPKGDFSEVQRERTREILKRLKIT